MSETKAVQANIGDPVEFIREWQKIEDRHNVDYRRDWPQVVMEKTMQMIEDRRILAQEEYARAYADSVTFYTMDAPHELTLKPCGTPPAYEPEPIAKTWLRLKIEDKGPFEVECKRCGKLRLPGSYCTCVTDEEIADIEAAMMERE